MSNIQDFKPPILVTGEVSDEPSKEYHDEVLSYTPTKALRHLYERQLDELSSSRKALEARITEMQSKVDQSIAFRVAHARIKRGKVEALIQLIFVTLLTGAGGMMVAIWPRIDDINRSPWQFFVGSTLIGCGVFLGAVIKPATLIACYVYPYFCKDSLPEE